MDYQNNQQNSQPRPVYQNPAEKPVSVGDWFLTTLILCIPLVGIIMLFVWGFGNGTSESKRNWARAQLIWMLVGIVLGLLFGASVVALLASLMS